MDSKEQGINGRPAAILTGEEARNDCSLPLRLVKFSLFLPVSFQNALETLGNRLGLFYWALACDSEKHAVRCLPPVV
jgi:hypothetical protein